MYKQIINFRTGTTADYIIHRIADNAFIPFDPDNTDYANFKIDLTNGVELQDANNTVMTANQISAFIATLP